MWALGVLAATSASVAYTRSNVVLIFRPPGRIYFGDHHSRRALERQDAEYKKLASRSYVHAHNIATSVVFQIRAASDAGKTELVIPMSKEPKPPNPDYYMQHMDSATYKDLYDQYLEKLAEYEKDTSDKVGYRNEHEGRALIGLLSETFAGDPTIWFTLKPEEIVVKWAVPWYIYLKRG